MKDSLWQPSLPSDRIPAKHNDQKTFAGLSKRNESTKTQNLFNSLPSSITKIPHQQSCDVKNDRRNRGTLSKANLPNHGDPKMRSTVIGKEKNLKILDSYEMFHCKGRIKTGILASHAAKNLVYYSNYVPLSQSTTKKRHAFPSARKAATLETSEVQKQSYRCYSETTSSAATKSVIRDRPHAPTHRKRVRFLTAEDGPELRNNNLNPNLSENYTCEMTITGNTKSISPPNKPKTKAEEKKGELDLPSVFDAAKYIVSRRSCPGTFVANWVRFSDAETDGLKQHNNSADPKLSGDKLKDSCDMTLTAGSQTSKVASRLHHKARSSHQKAKIENEPDSRRDLSPVSNITNDVISRRSCPDSFVAKLIANSKNETLFDPTESPTLLKKTRRRPTWSKKACKDSTIQNLKMGSICRRLFHKF